MELVVHEVFWIGRFPALGSLIFSRFDCNVVLFWFAMSGLNGLKVAVCV